MLPERFGFVIVCNDRYICSCDVAEYSVSLYTWLLAYQHLTQASRDNYGIEQLYSSASDRGKKQTKNNI